MDLAACGMRRFRCVLLRIEGLSGHRSFQFDSSNGNVESFHDARNGPDLDMAPGASVLLYTQWGRRGMVLRSDDIRYAYVLFQSCHLYFGKENTGLQSSRLLLLFSVTYCHMMLFRVLVCIIFERFNPMTRDNFLIICDTDPRK